MPRRRLPTILERKVAWKALVDALFEQNDCANLPGPREAPRQKNIIPNHDETEEQRQKRIRQNVHRFNRRFKKYAEKNNIAYRKDPQTLLYQVVNRPEQQEAGNNENNEGDGHQATSSDQNELKAALKAEMTKSSALEKERDQYKNCLVRLQKKLGDKGRVNEKVQAALKDIKQVLQEKD